MYWNHPPLNPQQTLNTEKPKGTAGNWVIIRLENRPGKSGLVPIPRSPIWTDRPTSSFPSRTLSRIGAENFNKKWTVWNTFTRTSGPKFSRKQREKNVGVSVKAGEPSPPPRTSQNKKKKVIPGWLRFKTKLKRTSSTNKPTHTDQLLACCLLCVSAWKNVTWEQTADRKTIQPSVVLSP